MKALVIDDPSVSGMCGTVCHLILEGRGHEARFIQAPLLFDGSTGYSADHILSVAKAMMPEWVVMVLQGRDASPQIAVAASIFEETPQARFCFISGSAHREELDHAHKIGLKLLFKEMPVNPEELVACLEAPA